MPNHTKIAFLEQLKARFGQPKKLEGTQSLFDIGSGVARLYVRYSKLHSSHATFYGLRREDLLELQGHRSYLCFLWDGQIEPLIVPFSEFEDVFQNQQPANDGQFKVQVLIQKESLDLYIARAGRFNVESYVGWSDLQWAVDSTSTEPIPSLLHNQVQTLLGAIGAAK